MTISVRVDPVGGIDLETARSGGHGPTVIFLHGLGGNHRSWDPQLTALAPDFHSIAWTMPGYGRSAAPTSFDFASLADSAAALIDEVGGPATVVGHSMGGFVAQELALRHPEKVQALVLAGTTAAFGKPGSDFNREFLAARLAPLDRGATPADLAPDVVDGLLAPGRAVAMRRSAIESMSGITADGYRRALETLVTWDARHRLSELAVPTLCIAGEVDTTAPPKAVSRLAELIPGARVEIVPGAGHLMNVEAPELFSDLIRRFADGAHPADPAEGRAGQP